MRFICWLSNAGTFIFFEDLPLNDHFCHSHLLLWVCLLFGGGLGFWWYLIITAEI